MGLPTHLAEHIPFPSSVINWSEYLTNYHDMQHWGRAPIPTMANRKENPDNIIKVERYVQKELGHGALLEHILTEIFQA